MTAEDAQAQQTLRWAGLIMIAVAYTVLYIKDRQLRKVEEHAQRAEADRATLRHL